MNVKQEVHGATAIRHKVGRFGKVFSPGWVSLMHEERQHICPEDIARCCRHDRRGVQSIQQRDPTDDAAACHRAPRRQSRK
jgi:hypothetical protein